MKCHHELSIVKSRKLKMVTSTLQCITWSDVGLQCGAQDFLQTQKGSAACFNGTKTALRNC